MEVYSHSRVLKRGRKYSIELDIYKKRRDGVYMLV